MPSGARVKVNRTRWSAVVRASTDRAAETAAESFQRKVSEEIYSAGRVQTGRMASDWFVEPAMARTANGSARRVVSPHKRTIYQNFGTRGSRPIPPRKALKFQVGGRTVFATRTRPITPARFIERAIGSMTVGDWLT